MFPKSTIHLPGMMIHLSFLCLLVLFAFERVDAASLFRTDTIHTQFTSTNNPDISMRFVTNSGVCETTPGVQQISGYLNIGKNTSMVSIYLLLNNISWSLIWDSVVLVLWVSKFSGNGSFHTLVCPILVVRFAGTQVVIFPRLNGGPGCSSMVGLFRGNFIKIILKSIIDIRFQKMDHVW